MVFTILGGCSAYANDKNVRECECTYGSYRDEKFENLEN